MNALLARLRALVQRVVFWLPWKTAPKEDQHSALDAHDHALLLAVTQPRRVPGFRSWRYAIRLLSSREQRWFVIGFVVFCLGLALSVTVGIRQWTIQVPAVGGTLTEGLVGEPKYLNPVDAPANDIDRDISSLVYSGLFRMDGMNPVPDLAEKYSWSEDGKTLTVTLREDARFHNGDQVTPDDIQFTIESIQDPVRSSPLAAFFRGVRVITVDDHTLQFTQDQADVSLLTTLSIGILPARVWQDIPATNAHLADVNLKPIGSGPYHFKSFTRDSHGFLRSLTLERSDLYYGVKPLIKTLTFQFFPDRTQAEEALKGEVIDSLAFVNTTDAKNTTSDRWHHVRLDLPQETVAFFNLKKKILADSKVREVLASVIDRHDIVDAWQDRAVPVTDPFPFMQGSSTLIDLEQGRTLLDKAGWILAAGGDVRIGSGSTSGTILELTITTSDQPELMATAEALKRRWSLLGVKVNVTSLPAEDLLRVATRERSSDVILINVLLGPEQDLFPFWWSGQINDRGLNISYVVDRDIDEALNKTRTAATNEALTTARATLAAAIEKTHAAVFLVRPAYLYNVSQKVKGVEDTLTISRPADRLQAILGWYIKTGRSWKK